MIVPGRILVIDDVHDEIVKVIDSLRQEGESVLFAPSMPEKDEFLENIRLLIIDLYLVGDDKEASYEAVVSILDKLSQKSRFFIIAIWTKYARNTDKDLQIVEDLKNCYKSRTETDLPAIFLEPFGKSILQVELFDRIKKSLASHPECGLLFEIERSIENARGPAVSDLVARVSVSVILKALEEESGDVALSRHMINLFLKILGRHCKSTDTMSGCIEKLLAEPRGTEADKYGDIHNLESYCSVSNEELIWTGDVLEKRNGKEEYAVIVTPACDFAQRRKRPLDYVKIIHAVRVNHSDLLACRDNPEVLKGMRIILKTKLSAQECVRAVLRGRSLKKRLFILRYLKDDQEDTFFHLVLDFQQVSNLSFKETGALLEKEGWRRICRVDPPIIDNLLQTYSAYSARIGIPSIPRDIVEGIIDKIKKS